MEDRLKEDVLMEAARYLKPLYLPFYIEVSLLHVLFSVWSVPVPS